MNNLQKSMMQYIEHHQFLKPDSKVLAAISGGIDSMVMLRLLHASEVNTVAAHCNFGLRGNESDDDEAFVRNETNKLGILLHVAHFDTSAYAAQNGLSIQMAARELRHRWFLELAEQFDFDAISIAHNRDDRIETLFINMARGTGIHGLTGIKPKNGKIIRPLLFASREEIERYAQTHDIAFREDSTNVTDKYARNYIRHHVLPGLEQFFPGLRQAIDRNMERLSAVESFYNEAIEQYKSKIITMKDDLMYIDLQELKESPSPPTLLYEILKPSGFPNTVASEILEETLHPSGRQFYSDTHRLLQDRKSLILQKLADSTLSAASQTDRSVRPVSVDKPDSVETEKYIPFRLKIDKFSKNKEFIPDIDPNVACLDAQKLQFPLLLRKWKHGDTFRPLGMKKMKKLSDFFIDIKLSLIEKERRWVLVSEGQIVWIVGLRIDDRFKVTNETTDIVKFLVQYL